MGRPVAETAPPGLDAYWQGVWNHALKVMKEQASWSWELKPLLDEYVYALVDASLYRGQPTHLDRTVKRAQTLADQLALTPRGRKAAGIVGSDEAEDKDPLARVDELAIRRAG